MTALRTCVCMLACLDRPLTEILNKQVYITKIELMHLVGDREGLIARVQRRLPGVETTQVEAHMATYCFFATIINGGLPTSSTNFNHDGG